MCEFWQQFLGPEGFVEWHRYNLQIFGGPDNEVAQIIPLDGHFSLNLTEIMGAFFQGKRTVAQFSYVTVTTVHKFCDSFKFSGHRTLYFDDCTSGNPV